MTDRFTKEELMKRINDVKENIMETVPFYAKAKAAEFAFELMSIKLDIISSLLDRDKELLKEFVDTENCLNRLVVRYSSNFINMDFMTPTEFRTGVNAHSCFTIDISELEIGDKVAEIAIHNPYLEKPNGEKAYESFNVVILGLRNGDNGNLPFVLQSNITGEQLYGDKDDIIYIHNSKVRLYLEDVNDPELYILRIEICTRYKNSSDFYY